MADATFASLGIAPRGFRSECPLCGERTEGTVQILLQARKPGKKPRSVSSVSKRLCERHSVELYRVLDDAWRRFFEGGPS